jgi:hypothetical protein
MGSAIMSEKFDFDFSGTVDARAQIRAAVEYLLSGAGGSARSEIVLEIIEIVREVANGVTPGRPNPFDDDPPGG